MSREVLAAAGAVCATMVLSAVVAVAATPIPPIPINNAECTVNPTDGSPPQVGYCTGTVNLNPATSGQSDLKSDHVNPNPVAPARSFPFGPLVAGAIVAVAVAIIVVDSRKHPKFPRRKRLKSSHQG